MSTELGQEFAVFDAFKTQTAKYLAEIFIEWDKYKKKSREKSKIQ